MPELSDIEVACRSVRLQRAGLKVDGVEFDLRKYPFLIEIYDTAGTVPRMTVRKGAQLGLTACWVLCVIDLALTLYPRGILYLMPTRDDVLDFSRARFDRLLKDNWEYIGRKVRGTDSMAIKRIGQVFVYFRGAKSRSQMKSIPCDLLVEDERDEMDPAAVELVKHRLDGSDFKHEIDFSTPTLPEYGVDYNYKASDQRTWHIKCQHCGAWTCLELEFPKSLEKKADGTVIRCCARCRREVYTKDGRHVAAYPDRSEKHVGYYLSQLVSPRVLPQQIWEDYEEAELSGGIKLKEFRNSRLGIGHADMEDMMDEAMLRNCCSEDPSRSSAQGPCFMGVDIGKSTHHYWIGQRTGPKSLEILRYGVADWELLHDLYSRFNVCVAVFDEMAETHSVRKFKETHNGVYGCWYSEAQRTDYDWDDIDRRLTVNRTETLDASHKVVLRQEVKLPRPSDEWKPMVLQMANLARILLTDDETGTRKARWVVRGARKNDHYRHAWAYAVLAAGRAPVMDRARRIITPSEASQGVSWMAG